MRTVADIRLNVLLVSRRKEVLDSLQTLLRNAPGLRVEQKLVVNGHIDPLHDVAQTPDVLVLHLGETRRAELQSLAARPLDQRPPLVVIGSTHDPETMRLAMHAGARDLLPLPLVEADLLAALQRIERDHRSAPAAQECIVTAFINAKGGCGGTFLACNVAHALATRNRRRTVLLDLDLQFGSIPLYFDLFPSRGLLQALENVADLDDTALNAYLTEHESGLAILGQASQDPLPLSGVAPESLQSLLTLLARTHEHILVDLPRHLDAQTCGVLVHAERIVLVVQQSVTVLRDAARLVTCLRRDVAVGPERLLTVVNRYDKRSSITPEDVARTIGCGAPLLVPNDYSSVAESIATGRPLLAQARNTAVAKSIVALAEKINGTAPPPARGLLGRTLFRLGKPESS